MNAEVIGPFSQHRVVIGGYIVPHLTVSTVKSQGPEDGMFNVMLDERFCVCCTQEELDKWGWFIANAMAHAAGYSSFGENSNPVNPYRRQCTELRREDLEP